MQSHQAALVNTVLLLVLALSLGPAPGEAFRLFGGGGSRGGNSSASRPPNETQPDASLGRNVRLLVRKVDARDPYYRSMSFFVPAELNYMLGEYLLRDFKRAVEKHCNVSNITMVVQNDLVLVRSDTDVWRFRDGDRIEVWTRSSGPPTRYRTAAAFARKFRPGGRPPCPPGQRRCGRPGGYRGRPGGRDDEDGVPVPDDSGKVEVTAESDGIDDDEPIVVPDWSQMP